jgi:hypothetical protein
VGLRQKTSEKKEGKKRMMLEGAEEGSVAPLELSDGVMEEVEAMAKELRRIREMEDVQRVDRKIETEKVLEDSESEEEEEEEKKRDDGKEDEGVSDGTDDGEKGEGN